MNINSLRRIYTGFCFWEGGLAVFLLIPPLPSRPLLFSLLFSLLAVFLTCREAASLNLGVWAVSSNESEISILTVQQTRMYVFLKKIRKICMPNEVQCCALLLDHITV